MTYDELSEAIFALRALESEVTDIEAKSAVGGLPKSVRAAVSAFGNTVGGVILLGIDESSGFSAVGVQGAGKLASDLSSMLADEFEPPIRALISQLEFEGHMIVVAEIPAVSYEQRPCFYKGAGMSTGSWTRTGASNRKLTPYEVQIMLASRGQPRDDERADGARCDQVRCDRSAVHAHASQGC